MIRHTFALVALSVAAMAAEAPLLHLVHPDSKIIAGVQVDRTLASPLGRHLLAQIDENDTGFRRFIEQTGLDPRQDLRDILLVSADPQRKHGLVIARGVFDGPRILRAAKEHGAVEGDHSGVPLVSRSGGAIAILDGSIALAGDSALVKYAIDHRRVDTSPPAFPLAVKAAGMASRYDAWGVTLGAPKPPVTPSDKGMPIGPALQGIVETSAGFEFGSVVRISAEAVTRSERDAQSLVDVIRFMETMVRNSGSNKPNADRVETILNSLDVRAEASTVKLSIAVPEADLEQWIKPRRRAETRAAR